LRANMQGAHHHALSKVGMGMYAAPPSMGEGMYASGMHPRHRIAGDHHKRMIERGTVGMGGNLLGMNPALMSQPYSANFQFASRLPPAYANQIKHGGGMY
jgi:hypothetical protein